MSNSAALNKLNDATAAEQTATVDKGKGKAQVVEDDSSSDEEMEIGDETLEVEEEDDEFAEIDTSNIIQSGRRTRGNQIDFAAAQVDEMTDDDDDDEDDDFKAPVEDEDDAMDTK